MPATEYHGSSAPLASFGRSILSIRRHQIHTSEGAGDSSGNHAVELDAFQRHTADLFHDLEGGGGGGREDCLEILSIDWIRLLLDTFIICFEEFRAILFNGRGGADAVAVRPPLDRLVADFFERAVKALDIYNALRDGIAQVKQWQKHIEIALAALGPRNRLLTSGQIRRGKKALTELHIMMLDDKDYGTFTNHRNRSFGRKDGHNNSGGGGGGHFRSLSWSVSRSWSAAKQIQAIGNNLNAPKNNDITTTNGLAIPVFTMSSVLFFTTWALVAAIPCQDRGLQTHFSIPRNLLWSAPLLSMHERILEESKKKDRKHSNGLLKEIHQVEKCIRDLIDLLDSTELPLGEAKEAELRQEVEELQMAFESMKVGLDPIERQVREVFHRIVLSRTESIDFGMLQV